MTADSPGRFVSLAEVKSIMKKAEKEREELTYEQRNALDHAQLFAKLSMTDIKKLIKDLNGLEFIQENHAYKIADILPIIDDDVRAIFAKERFTLDASQIKQILEIVGKYYVEEK